MASKAQQQEANESKSWLLSVLKPGDTVYCILRHTSASGMQREIGLVVFVDGRPWHPNYRVSKLLGSRMGKQDGIIRNGCGMDMGADLVMNLSYALFGDSYALRQEWL